MTKEESGPTHMGDFFPHTCVNSKLQFHSKKKTHAERDWLVYLSIDVKLAIRLSLGEYEPISSESI